MNCKKAKKFCLLYQELSASENQELQTHLKDCKDCCQEFEAYQNSLNLVSRTLRFEEPQNFWGDYWTKLSHRISRKSGWSRMWERFAERLAVFTRPVYGPVPAYAVTVALLILFLGLFPVWNNKSQAKFESNLVVHQTKLISADVHGSLTVYKLAQR